jgi:GNAT superfamily N-acetyltransferase
VQHEPQVVEIDAAATRDLRRRVLRTGTPITDVRWDDDELPVTSHLGVLLDGRLVAVSTWIERRHPDHPAIPGVQLRGMATDPSLQGRGIGALLLHEGLRRSAAAGAGLVWARARDTATPFYVAHGFDVIGRGYIDLTTQIPHHDVIRLLAGEHPDFPT